MSSFRLPKRIHYETIPLTSTERDRNSIRIAETKCNDILKRGDKIVNVQMVCGCNKDLFPVPVARKFINLGMSPYGHTLIRIAWKEPGERKRTRRVAYMREGQRRFHFHIVFPGSGKYTDHVLQEIEENSSNIEREGGEIITSSVACGCAPEFWRGFGWLNHIGHYISEYSRFVRGGLFFGGAAGNSFGLIGYVATPSQQTKIKAGLIAAVREAVRSALGRGDDGENRSSDSSSSDSSSSDSSSSDRSSVSLSPSIDVVP